MRIVYQAGITALALWLVPTAASALEVIRAGGSGDNDYILIGEVEIKDVGTRFAVCVDDPDDENDEVYYPFASNKLTDDVEVHGDSIDSGTGDDTMLIVASADTDPPSSGPGSFCHREKNLEIDGQWDPPVYDGYYLDLYGDGGDEKEMDDGGGSNDTWMSGDGGHDYLEQHSSIGRALGQDGNDTIWGLTGGNGDYLWGHDGDDCLWDDDDSFSALNCGDHVSGDSHGGNTGTTNCENLDQCCSLC